ncbi:fed tick salivary protein 8 [Chytridium lagenaria]|nr:fed tick salivary protein 8 [Chytridium lagenaria]
MLSVFDDLSKVLEGERRLRDDIKAQCTELDRTCRETGVILSIFHSTHDKATLDEALAKAETAFQRLRQVVQQLSSLVPENQFYKLNMYWSNTMQSACFSAAFYVFLKTGTMMTVEQAEEILGTKVDIKSTIHTFHITVDEFLQGILSLSGELSRLAGNSVILGDFQRPVKIHKFLCEVYAGFQLLNLKNDGLRKRFDGLKYEVKRVEEIVYDISVRGLNKTADMDV